MTTTEIARLSDDGALRTRAHQALDDLCEEHGFEHGFDHVDLHAIRGLVFDDPIGLSFLEESIRGSGELIYDEDALHALSELMDNADDWNLVVQRLIEAEWPMPQDLTAALSPRDMYIALVYGASLLLLEE